MSKLFFVWCLFFINCVHSSIKASVQSLEKIDDEHISQLQEMLQPYVKNSDVKQCGVSVIDNIEQGLARYAATDLSPLNTLHEHLINCRHNITRYNQLLEEMNVKRGDCDMHQQYSSILADGALRSSLHIKNDTIEQLEKYARSLIASKNINFVSHLQDSMKSWGLLYGPLVGTLFFFKHLCLPRNISTYGAATVGFFGAFTLLKSTPRSTVNDSVVKTSVFCVAGSAATVAACQLWQSLDADQYKEKLVTFNLFLAHQNVAVSNIFRSLDTAIVGIQTRNGVETLQQEQRFLSSSVEKGFAATSIQHQQTRQAIQSVGDRVDQVGVDTQGSLHALSGELAAHKANQNGRFDAVEKQIGLLHALVQQVNVALKKHGQQFTITAEQLNGYFTSDAKDRELLMKYLQTEIGAMQGALVYNIMQGAEIRDYLHEIAIQTGAKVPRRSLSSPQLCLTHQLYKQVSIASYKSKIDMKRGMKSWNEEQTKIKESLPLFKVIASDVRTSRLQEKISNQEQSMRHAAATIIQSKMREKLVRKKISAMKSIAISR